MPAHLPHVIVITTGSGGDLFPFIRLALGLRRRGHAVTMLAPDLHEPFVRAAGLDFHGLPAELAVLDDPDLWHPRRGFGVVWRATRPGMAAALAFVDALPATEDIALVVHPLAIPEADLCRAAHPGLRVVAAYLAPSNLRTVHDPLMLGPYRVPRWVPRLVRRGLWQAIGTAFIDPVALPGINAARGALKMAPVRSLFDHLRDVPDLSVALFPAWFAPPQPDWPRPFSMGDFALYDPYPDAPLPSGLAQFLAAGPPPLVVTPGTGNRQAAAVFSAALAAAQRLKRRIVLLTPHREQLPPDLPDGAYWQDSCSLPSLLPKVALLIHHGGIGTTAEALRAGTPQLIVAMAFDQFDNANRAAALGVGRCLTLTHCSAQALVSYANFLLDTPAVHKACTEVQQHFGGIAKFEQLIDLISNSISKTGKI